MSGKQPITHTVDLLRRIERTIITSGRDGCTIEDLRAATGTTRRTVDRLLDALQTLGSGITLDYDGGPVAGTWTHAGAVVFAHERKRGKQVSWTFRVDHTAIVKDAHGRQWKVEIKINSFGTFSWVARPIQWVGDITISSGNAAWPERLEAQQAAAKTLSATGFTDE